MPTYRCKGRLGTPSRSSMLFFKVLINRKKPILTSFGHVTQAIVVFKTNI